jgi:hypothetical protein
MKIPKLSIIIIVVVVVGIAIIFSSKFLFDLQRLSEKRFQPEFENPFVTGSEELKSCLRKTIGDKAFEEIAQNKRQITNTERKDVETCFELERARNEKTPAPTKEFFESDLVDTSQLSRNYPEFIICEYVSEMDVIPVVFDLEKFKEAGLNTICIYLTPPKYSPTMSPKDKEAEWRILKIKWAVGKIKKAGFAVLLDQDVGAGSWEGELLVTKGTSDELLSEMEKENLMWARVAEEYKIEYLSPFGEIEDKLDWFLEKEGLTKEKRIAKTNEWLSQLAPKLREVYKGRLIAHYGELYPELDPGGYDYFGSTVDVGSVSDPTDLNEFRRMIRDTYQVALALEEKTQSEWIIPEIFFAYEELNVGPDIQKKYEEYGEQLKELQDDYFRITFEEILNLPPEKRPRGVETGGYVLDFGGYGPVTFSPLTDEARSEIKKFLSQIE